MQRAPSHSPGQARPAPLDAEASGRQRDAAALAGKSSDAAAADPAADAARLRQVDLRATARRLLILEVIAGLPEGEVSAIAVLRETYARGIYIPLPSVYRIIRELKRRGVVKAGETRR